MIERRSCSRTPLFGAVTHELANAAHDAERWFASVSQVVDEAWIVQGFLAERRGGHASAPQECVDLCKKLLCAKHDAEDIGIFL